MRVTKLSTKYSLMAVSGKVDLKVLDAGAVTA